MKEEAACGLEAAKKRCETLKEFKRKQHEEEEKAQARDRQACRSWAALSLSLFLGLGLLFPVRPFLQSSFVA